ncbi:MAG: Uma2 family endonuclease [bacterium]|nr:Uma2 family endonuclease [bacterium]
MLAQPQSTLCAEEYLAFERQSETKHEFLDGEIVAMSGASRAHGLIAWNLSGILYPQLKTGGYEAFSGDMRVHIPVTERYTYPDLVVACGEPQFEDEELDTLLNPTLIVEILSPTTEDKDRGTKLFQYRSIPSLQVILLVAQDKVHVEQFRRQQDGTWLLTDFDGLEDVLELPTIGSWLDLADVYDRVPGL